MIQIAERLATPLEYSGLSHDELVGRIHRRKQELNAVILGHNYQRLEIQAVSDYLGDSLGLSQEAASTDADVIVFCGVHFMAETAKILSPQKTVLMPDLRAGCPMADFVTADSLRKLKRLYPEAVVVTYVNSTAAVKAESDICCTSANAVDVVNSFARDRTILFVPDRNLADYVARKTGRPVRNSSEFLNGTEAFSASPRASHSRTLALSHSRPEQLVEPGTIIAWDGYCYVHDDLVLQELAAAKRQHPDAKVIIHPEARADLLARADYVVSTAGMGALAEQHDKLIIGTERGLIDRLQQRFPQKTIVPLSRAAICGNMKVNTLAKLAWCLDHEQHELVLPEDVRVPAKQALQRMLELCKGWGKQATAEEERLEQGGLRPRGCGCA